AAVAVAGQIAFVGLIVPHLVRLAGVREHRPLLLLSALAGAVFLAGADLLQIVLCRDQLAPGVVMSLLGGPFFVALLWRERRSIALW
ncbi:MAG: iron chelate uptake ABC transporter family permease subunit, partial [Planctomycetes bacterium]|nr:iron chelate uptake ABC transporter family permease subunit [Planctomycetota bacterium]